MMPSSSRRLAQTHQLWFGVFALWLAAGLGFIAGRWTTPSFVSAQEAGPSEITPEISKAAVRWQELGESERARYRRLYQIYRRQDENRRQEIRRIARLYTRLDESQQEVIDGCLERFESLSPQERRRLRPALARQQRRLLSGSGQPWLRFRTLSALSPKERAERLRRNERWQQLGDEPRRLLIHVLFGD